MSEQKTIRQYAEDYSIGLNEREALLSHTAFIDGAAKQKELDNEREKLLMGVIDKSVECLRWFSSNTIKCWEEIPAEHLKDLSKDYMIRALKETKQVIASIEEKLKLIKG